MRGWIVIGSLVSAAVTFGLLWIARANYRSLGCVETPETTACTDALNTVYLYGGVGAGFALIAIVLMGRKG